MEKYMLNTQKCYSNNQKPNKDEIGKYFTWSVNNTYLDADKKRSSHCKVTNILSKNIGPEPEKRETLITSIENLNKLF